MECNISANPDGSFRFLYRSGEMGWLDEWYKREGFETKPQSQQNITSWEQLVRNPGDMFSSTSSPDVVTPTGTRILMYGMTGHLVELQAVIKAAKLLGPGERLHLGFVYDDIVVGDRNLETEFDYMCAKLVLWCEFIRIECGKTPTITLYKSIQDAEDWDTLLAVDICYRLYRRLANKCVVQNGTCIVTTGDHVFVKHKTLNPYSWVQYRLAINETSFPDDVDLFYFDELWTTTFDSNNVWAVVKVWKWLKNVWSGK